MSRQGKVFFSFIFWLNDIQTFLLPLSNNNIYIYIYIYIYINIYIYIYIYIYILRRAVNIQFDPFIMVLHLRDVYMYHLLYFRAKEQKTAEQTGDSYTNCC